MPSCRKKSATEHLRLTKRAIKKKRAKALGDLPDGKIATKIIILKLQGLPQINQKI